MRPAAPPIPGSAPPSPGGRGEHLLVIRDEADAAVARSRARELAGRLRLREGKVGAVLTAVSEIARNLVVHAGGGELALALVEERGRRGLLVVARDRGGGIRDVELAMRDGWSSRGGLGLGLPSARRLMDEFTLETVAGEGTTVTMKKWADDQDR